MDRMHMTSYKLFHDHFVQRTFNSLGEEVLCLVSFNVGLLLHDLLEGRTKKKKKDLDLRFHPPSYTR
jgi:hypothetical protein